LEVGEDGAEGRNRRHGAGFIAGPAGRLRRKWAQRISNTLGILVRTSQPFFVT
jgi:hypothetical protein